MGEVIAAGWITVDEAEKETGYSVAYLRRLARQGRIEAQKVGVWLIHRDSLLAYKETMDRLGDSRHNPLAPWRDVGGRDV